jgi:hypothetical protein
MRSQARVHHQEPAQPQYLSVKECLAKAVQADEVARHETQPWTKELYQKIADGWREAAMWSAGQSAN